MERAPLSFGTTLSSALLDIDDKRRTNPLAWRGQFSPQLIESLLASYAPPSARVLDPFAGSGTVLFEAARLGFEAHGVEINPAAGSLARLAEFINIPHEQRRRHLSMVEKTLAESVGAAEPLFAPARDDTKTDWLEELVSASRKGDIALRVLLQALLVRLDLGKNHVDVARVWSTWRALSRLVADLPFSTAPIRFSLGDARALPLANQEVEFVVTSPPYINVFNYHHHYRGSAEALGWKPLAVARSEIGANRKFRQNRFLTVIQYCMDMAQFFAELYRVCRPRCRVLMILGRESSVHKTPFFNGSIVLELARATGLFSKELQQERVFQNRFGQQIFEDILHLNPQNVAPINPTTVTDTGRAVGLSVLQDALERVPKDRRHWLEQAILEDEKAQPSPLLKTATIGPHATQATQRKAQGAAAE